MDVAADNPDVLFLTWAGYEIADNVGHFDAASEDGRYLDGMIAGMLTESNIIGYPVGFPYNEVNRAVNAFTMGAREVNPDAEVQRRLRQHLVRPGARAAGCRGARQRRCRRARPRGRRPGVRHRRRPERRPRDRLHERLVAARARGVGVVVPLRLGPVLRRRRSATMIDGTWEPAITLRWADGRVHHVRPVRTRRDRRDAGARSRSASRASSTAASTCSPARSATTRATW